MKICIALAVAALLTALQGEEICRHSARGATTRVSMEKVRRAQQDVRDRFAWAAEKAARVSPDIAYESGLPACRARRARRVRTPVPAPLLGKTLAFAPAHRMPSADFRAATSARSLVSIETELLGDASLAKRLGVTCTPTLVRFVSEAELELVENP